MKPTAFVIVVRLFIEYDRQCSKPNLWENMCDKNKPRQNIYEVRLSFKYSSKIPKDPYSVVYQPMLIVLFCGFLLICEALGWKGRI